MPTGPARSRSLSATSIEERRKSVPDELKDDGIVRVRSGTELRDAATADG